MCNYVQCTCNHNSPSSFRESRIKNSLWSDKLLRQLEIHCYFWSDVSVNIDQRPIVSQAFGLDQIYIIIGTVISCHVNFSCFPLCAATAVYSVHFNIMYDIHSAYNFEKKIFRWWDLRGYVPYLACGRDTFPWENTTVSFSSRIWVAYRHDERRAINGCASWLLFRVGDFLSCCLDNRSYPFSSRCYWKMQSYRMMWDFMQVSVMWWEMTSF